MTMRKVIVWAILILAAGMWGYAQTPTPQLELRVQGGPTQPPTIITGTDLGFRIDGRRGNTPIGRIVIRVNGEWVEVEDPMAVKRLTAR
jgi:hypothetical protein